MLHPPLHIRFLRWNIHSFHFFGVLGFIAGAILGILLASTHALRIDIVLLMIGVGAATFFGLVYLVKWFTGKEMIVYYHHEISIMILTSLVLWMLRIPILPYIDIAILGIATFLAFGRIGCYSVGCCHGKPHRFGVKYGRAHVDAGFTWYYRDISLFPIQLVESVTVGLAIISGVILLFNNIPPGTIFIFYTISYGMCRYVFEFLRGDPERPVYLGLSEAQWTSLSLANLTFGMSKIGWLPYYSWHLYLLMVMLGATLATILFFSNRTRGLLSPRHIQEIAEGLHLLNQNRSVVARKQVPLYLTKAGLCLSTGSYHEMGREIEQYTISFQKGILLHTGLTTKMAKLISLLKVHGGGFEIIEKKEGIYHILFSKTSLLESNPNTS